MLSLWFVRHGETDWNTEGRVQGWTDVPLNLAGEAQAARLANALQGIPFCHLVSSDLIRAKRTAHIIAESTRTQVQLDRELRERGFGSAEGMIRTDAVELYGGDAPDAEPVEAVDQRAYRFCEQRVRQQHVGRILCVTHGGFVRAIMRAHFHQDVPSPPNTSVTRIDYVGGQWTLVAFGSTFHLDSQTSYNT